MGILKLIGIVFLVAVFCAGVIAIATAIIWVKMNANFDDKVEREVNRRLRNTIIRSKFNVRTVVVDETSDADEETQMRVSEWDEH